MLQSLGGLSPLAHGNSVLATQGAIVTPLDGESASLRCFDVASFSADLQEELEELAGVAGSVVQMLQGLLGGVSTALPGLNASAGGPVGGLSGKGASGEKTRHGGDKPARGGHGGGHRGGGGLMSRARPGGAPGNSRPAESGPSHGSSGPATAPSRPQPPSSDAGRPQPPSSDAGRPQPPSGSAPRPQPPSSGTGRPQPPSGSASKPQSAPGSTPSSGQPASCFPSRPHAPASSTPTHDAQQTSPATPSSSSVDGRNGEAETTRPDPGYNSEGAHEAELGNQEAAAKDEGASPVAETEGAHEAELGNQEAAAKDEEASPVAETEGAHEAELGNQEAAANEADGAGAAQDVPPNFNEMTEQEQYDYLRKVTIDQAGGDESAWKTGEDEVNLVGIRSWQDGQAGSTEGNTYNDSIYAVRMHNGQPEVYEFEGSVDAGIMGDNPRGFGRQTSEGLRFSHLADGHYDDGTFVETTSDTWGGRMVLGQGRDIRINVDMNNDGVIQPEERWNETQGTNWQINFHPGGWGDQVGEMSAGCQIIRPDQYDLFEQLLREDPNWTHGYTLVDSANLPLVGA